jgi:hypothetical protein
MLTADIWTHLPYLLLGILVISVGIWLVRTPRYSKIGTLLGSMFVYRILGVIFILIGLLTALAGLGLEAIGPYPITIN